MKPKTRPEDLDYMGENAAAVLEEAPRGARLILWLTALFVLLFTGWAAIAELDEVTRGSGKVIPSRQVQVIQNLEGGIVAELRVHEGATVEAGEVLLRIDDTRFASSFRESEVHRNALKAKVARLQAEAEGKDFVSPGDVQASQPERVAQELALFNARKAELESNLAILRQQVAQRRQEVAELRSRSAHLAQGLALVGREIAMNEPLVRQGIVSEVEVLRLRREANVTRGELASTQLSIPRGESRLAEAQRKLEEVELSFRNQARLELNAGLAELSGLSESSVALEDRVSRTQVRAPVRGIVKQLRVNTVGGVVQPGMDLIEIVPLEDTLLVEARVRPADIAFIHPGLKAMVKFSAYDFAIYGGLEGKVEHISADTLQNEKESYYLVRVRTGRNYLGRADAPLPIIPGMTATVDVLTGKKTLLHYLLKPVLRAREYALTER
ncbi:MAG: HlyD family type I secretion periplasmic adaptor subunit [Halothiobacillaceae bacterium]|nr:MAG: HlyD family type I secretion periplasmic adaptor subunit [Halothiobacillaceae bacterium]